MPTWAQDEAARLGAARRGAERGASEKKVAILEKALSLHPGSDELLLALLRTVRGCGGPVGLGAEGGGRAVQDPAATPGPAPCGPRADSPE